MASLVWEMQIMEEREIAIEIGYEIDREQKKKNESKCEKQSR